MLFSPRFPGISGTRAGCARQFGDSGAWYRNSTVSVESVMPRRGPLARELPTPVRLVAPATSAELPPPPAHLSEAMQAWWRQVMTDYQLEPHHLRLLEAACDAWDRLVQARETLREEGL